jgi:hypothetical protein
MNKELLGFISVTCAAIGYGYYIWTVIKRRTKPHAFSYGVWALLLSIIFLAQTSRGGASGAWVTGFSALPCIIIAGLALVWGEKNITRSDWVAFFGALLTIPIWYFTKNPLNAVVLAIIIDIFAYYPTFRKTWHRPYQENPFSYTMDVVKWIITLPALGSYSAVTVLSPLFFLTVNGSLVLMILWRRLRLRRNSNAA